MYRKELFTARRNALTLAIISIALAACLEPLNQGEGEGAVAESDPDPTVNSAPAISGNPTRAVNIGDMYSFAPSASDADGDELTFTIDNKPGWLSFDDGNGELSGLATLGDAGVYTNIRIAVSDGSNDASLPSFDITVDQAGNMSTTLSWTPPTENEDGSTLMDLAGYKIYWGTTPGDYTRSETINNPGISSYVVDDLKPGTYVFVATSFNAAGIESEYSSPITRVLN